MRKTIKKTVLLCGMAILGLGIMVAQDSENHEARKNSCADFMENLNDEQKSQLEKQKAMRKEHKEVFIATLSKSQLALRNNDKLSKLEKHKSLRETLTDSQKEIKQAQHAEIKKQKKLFMASLSDEQKSEFKSYNKRHKNKGKRGHWKGKRNKNEKPFCCQ